MAVIYKVYGLHTDPRDKKSPKRYYPRAITLGRSVKLDFITDKIKDRSSLSAGDVKSVLQNFIEKLKEQLLEGKTVNIEGLGCFKLSLKSKGEDTPEEVTAKSVDSVRICFKAHKDLRINKHETRAGDKLNFISLANFMGDGAEEDEVDAPQDGDKDNSSAENPKNPGDEDGSQLEF